MRTVSIPTLALVAGTALVAWSGGDAAADDETATPEFAPPVRLKAGDAFLGAGRLYPSPVVHDMDGDGRRDVLIGDLVGNVTFAPSEKGGDGGFALGAEQPLKNRKAEQLKFNNW